MPNFGQLATWHYRPKASTPQAWNAVWSRALGINEGRVREIGKWERSFNPLASTVTARLLSGERIEIESLSYESAPEEFSMQRRTVAGPPMRTVLELAEPLDATAPAFPEGEFDIELRATHRHPECPEATATVNVIREGTVLVVLGPVNWNLVQ